MLIPIFLIQACGRSPTEMGWMLAPFGIGMMATSLSMGALANRFGIRRVALCGALLTLAGTLPFLFLASHGFILLVMVPALFVRGMGQAAVMLPSMSAAYASVPRKDLPMATTTLNIVQRLGGPTLTTLCATLLAWGLGAHEPGLNAYVWSFSFLCGLHALMCIAATRLPPRMADTGDRART